LILPSAHVHLGADFEIHAVGRRGRVVDGLCAGLNVSVDAVVVRSREEAHVAEAVDGDSIVWGAVAESSGIAGDCAIVDIVVGLGTQKDTVTGKDNVAGDIRTLQSASIQFQISPNKK